MVFDAAALATAFAAALAAGLLLAAWSWANRHLSPYEQVPAAKFLHKVLDCRDEERFLAPPFGELPEPDAFLPLSAGAWL
jgi:hypothetical protein